MHINQRGWTPIEDDPRWEEEGYYEQIRARCEALAGMWSRIQHESEQDLFRRQADYEDAVGWDEEEAAALDEEQNTRDEIERAELEIIERHLHELGARMMRAYEHWNEDEKYMEYMEKDRY